jgi:PAS domain S-box-containing protein
MAAISSSSASGADLWFAGSPLPMFETRLPELSEVLRQIRRRVGLVDRLDALTDAEIAAIQQAHRSIELVRGNAAMCAYFGVAAAELQSQWPMIRDGALSANVHDAHILQLVSGQIHTEWTADWRLSDGLFRAAKIVSRPLPGFERNLLSVSNTLMDVTEHRREARLMFEDNPTPTVEFDSTAVVDTVREALRDGLSEERAREVVAASFEQLRCMRANAAAVRFFAWPEATFCQRPQIILNPEALKASVQAIFDSITHDAAQRPYIAPIVRGDGAIRYALHRSRAIGLGSAPWSRTQVTYTDVTRQRVAEIHAQAHVVAAKVEAERQRARWERSAALANAASYELRVRDRMFLPSNSLEKLLGVSIDGLNESRQYFLPLVPQPWRDRLRDLFREALKSGEPLRYEHPLDRPDGQRIWIQSNFVVEASDDDEPESGYGYLQDVTARKQLEEQALAAVERAEAALGAKRDIIAAFLDEPSPSPAREAPNTDDRDLAALLARQLSVLREIEAGDHVLNRAMMALDESRLAAEGANLAKSQFLAVMSHELRTPLNAVIGYTEILEDELGPAAAAAASHDLNRIKAAAKHLLSLINEILDFAKIDAGKMELALEPTELAYLLNGAADLVRPMADAKGLAFQIEIDAEIGSALVDAKRLKQCVVNLLSNAQKFTPAGIVAMSARRLGDKVRIEVKDTGCGIAPGDMARLFEPFRQVDSSLARRHEGTGLGLAISRKLARLMGGDLTATSLVGVGSSFVLTIATDATDVLEAAA